MRKTTATIEYEGDENIDLIDHTLAKTIADDEGYTLKDYEVIDVEDKGDYREITLEITVQ